MIVCSCNIISDADLENALVEMMALPVPQLPTPGAVYKHLAKRMRCCGCAPLAIATIYDKMQLLERQGRICPYVGRSMRGQLVRFAPRMGPVAARRILAAE